VRLRDVTFGEAIVTGRLEVCYKNIWGTVCGTSVDTAVAEVARTQLGYPGKFMASIYTSGKLKCLTS